MPAKAFCPVDWSIGEKGLRIGPPPRSPVIAITPVKACRITS